VKDTVLIATPDALSALTRREDLSGAHTFSDADALSAVATIARLVPGMVAIDHLFAATSRGAAFIERLRRDPALVACEIRLVAPDAGRDAIVQASGPAASDIERSGVAESLDDAGTRAAPRFSMRDDLDVMLDGRPARLIDLSQGGAQVLTPVIVRPQQRVRIALRAADTRLRLSGTVQWASFEMLVDGPRYRAGVQFADAAPGALISVIDRYRQ
jgi:hypothetical protein